MTWREALHTNRIKWAIAICLLAVLFISFVMPTFYQVIIVPKKGILLNDPVLQLLKPRDWSLPTLIILYLSVIQTLATRIRNPLAVIAGVGAYCAVCIFRMATMYVVTLEPPSGMILLVDPISGVLYPDPGFAKDLFFSGHVSSMVIMVLLEKKRIAKTVKIIATILIAVLLAWQHVHYTIDLLAAPIVTYWIFRIIQKSVGLTEEGLQAN